MLCAAKFSVKQTSQLLQQRHSDGPPNGGPTGASTLYAELETGLDPELGGANVDPSSAEVSAQAFERLPEAATAPTAPGTVL